MIVDANFHIVSGNGWLELNGSKATVRKNGQLATTETGSSARLHVHNDGITVTLPPQLIEHLLQSIEWHFAHDENGRPLKEPLPRTVKITIRC